MLLLAAATIAAMPDWVPARWFSKDAATLRLVETTPINCLLLARANWSKEFVQAATERGIATWGSVENAADVQEAKQIGFPGTAVENDFDAGPSAIALSTRSKMKFDSDAKILATRQGIWPGIRGEQETHAAAS